MKPRSRVGGGKGKGTFDFLGFTFFWSKGLCGYWVIKKKTAGKRLRRFLKMMWQWCKENRHDPIEEQYKTLCSKLRGYYQYHGVRSNYKALETVFEYTEKAWRYWLSRRSHKGKVLFDDLRKSYPLPLPRIVHNIWHSLWAAKLCAKRGVACLVSNLVKRIRTEEPDEGNLHVRVCGGSAGQPVLLPGSRRGT